MVVGYGAQTGTYVTTPHVYVTANGPEEIDGPYIGNDTGFYSVYWQAPPYPTEIFSVSDSGTGIFSGGQAVPNGGPGTIVALGEVNDHSLAMEGYFHGLQHMWSNGVFSTGRGLLHVQIRLTPFLAMALHMFTTTGICNDANGQAARDDLPFTAT